MQHADLTALRDAIATGAASAEAACAAMLDAADRLNPVLNAYHETFRDNALAGARAIDADARAGRPLPPLAGVPLAVKDNIATVLGHTTCSSRMLGNYRSPFDASAVERLQSAGAITIGKTNLDEFAMGSSGEHCRWGPVRNPWDTARVPGGSSAGSAAAVAAGLCAAAIGSDTGGSIRQPASLCGIVGLKPTYGRVSRWGLVAFGSSLDQVGPMTRSVRDAALMLDCMSGLDARDSTTADRPATALAATVERPVEGLRVGIPRQYVSGANDPEVNAAVQAAADAYRAMGATIVEADLPLTDVGISTYYVIAPAEASSNLARYDGIRYGHRAQLRTGEDLFTLYARSRSEGFGPEVQRRIMLGTYMLSSGYYDAFYKRALQVRRRIKEEFDRAFAECDVLLGPTAPTPAFGFGANADPLAMYLCDVYTVNTNIAGICGVSLPAGHAVRDGKHLPIGVQLQANAFEEDRLLRAARMLERAFAERNAKARPAVSA
ncbi:MAG: Asp-tRNA(Asn)/Glu-tRNA(Gln) amidotransferase subunit GatA [Planctomycetota bacterium]